jgi:hypothetical protein
MEVALDIACREARENFPESADGEASTRDHIIHRMGELQTKQPEQLVRAALSSREYSHKVDSVAKKDDHGRYVIKNPPPEPPKAIAHPGQAIMSNDLRFWEPEGDPDSAENYYIRYGRNGMYRRR